MSKQVVTIGYMKSFVDGVVDVTHPSGDTYCPTYSELTGGSVCSVWSKAAKAHESVSGIFVSGYSVGDSREAYASNQLVLRSDVKLRWLSLTGLTVDASTRSLDACGDHSDITASALFDEITKSEGGSTAKTNTYSDSTIGYTVSADESWVSVVGSTVSVGMNSQCVNSTRSFNASASYSYGGVSKSGSVLISQAANVCTDYECPEGYEGSGYTMDSCGNKVSEDCTESTGCDITIVDFPQATAHSAKMCINTSYTWVAEATGQLTGSPYWDVSDTSVATIRYTGLTCEVTTYNVTGSTTITVSGGGCTGHSMQLSVYDASECYSNECKINVYETEMEIGDTYQWAVDCYGGAVWTSDNPLVASVSSDGLVTAISNGTTNIRARCNNCEGSDYWWVNVGSVGCSISEFTMSMEVGDTYQFEASCSDSTSPNPSWSSSDTDVLTVNSNGLVRAVGPGSASIYVSCSCGNDAVSDITVTNPGCTATSTSYTVECSNVSVGASATGASIPYTGIAADDCGVVEKEYLTYYATFPQNTASTPTERSFTINYHGHTCDAEVYQAASGCTPQPITYSNCAVISVSPSTLPWEGGIVSVSISATSSDTCSQGVYTVTENPYIPENTSTSPKPLNGTVSSPCGGNLTWGGVTQEGKPMPGCIVNSLSCSPTSATIASSSDTARTIVSVSATASGGATGCTRWEASNGVTGVSGDALVVTGGGNYTITATANPMSSITFSVSVSPSSDVKLDIKVNVGKDGNGKAYPWLVLNSLTGSSISYSVSIDGKLGIYPFSVAIDETVWRDWGGIEVCCGNFDTSLDYDDVSSLSINSLDFVNPTHIDVNDSVLSEGTVMPSGPC